MNSKLASVFATILHPIFLPLYAFMLIFYSGSYISFLPESYKIIVLSFLAINTIAIPLFSLYILKRIKFIRTIEMYNHRERVLPLLLSIIPFILTIYLFSRLRLPMFLIRTIQGGIYLIAITAILSLWWKVSLHACGAGAIVGFLFQAILQEYLSNTAILLVFIILSGCLLSTRLASGAHKPVEIYPAFLLGFLTLLISL